MSDKEMERTRTIWLGYKKVMEMLKQNPEIMERDLPKIVEFVGNQVLGAKEIALEALVRVKDLEEKLNNLGANEEV